MSRSSFDSDPGMPEVSSQEPSASYGVSNLDRKTQMVDDLDNMVINMDNVAELGDKMKLFFTRDMLNNTKKALNVVKSGLTPGFIKRYNAKKVHIEKIEDRER